MNDYINMIMSGGMALSTGYIVSFTFNTPNGVKTVIDYLAPSPSKLYETFCDEVSLPPSQAATGQVTGINLGEGCDPTHTLKCTLILVWGGCVI